MPDEDRARPRVAPPSARATPPTAALSRPVRATAPDGALRLSPPVPDPRTGTMTLVTRGAPGRARTAATTARRAALAGARRIVVKLGTNVVLDDRGAPAERRLAGIVAAIAR